MDLRFVPGLRPDQLRLHLVNYGLALVVSIGGGGMDLRFVPGLRPDQLRLHLVNYGLALVVSCGAAEEALPLRAARRRCVVALALLVSACWLALAAGFAGAAAGC